MMANIVKLPLLQPLLLLLLSSFFSWKFYLTFLFHSVCPFAMDVAFLLDSSGSIGSDNFLETKRFINEVVDHFQISPIGEQI